MQQTRTKQKQKKIRAVLTFVRCSCIQYIHRKKEEMPNTYAFMQISFHSVLVVFVAGFFSVYFLHSSFCLFTSSISFALSSVAAWSAFFYIVYSVCERQPNNITNRHQLESRFFFDSYTISSY